MSTPTSNCRVKGFNRPWLQQPHPLVRKELAHFRGQEVDTAGDGFLNAFDGPGRAVRCAMSISRQVRSLGIEIRAGLHSGECETMGSRLGGIAVHIGSRVASAAKLVLEPHVYAPTRLRPY